MPRAASSGAKIHSFTPNRTSKYLLVALKDWGTAFNQEFETVIENILKFGIHDAKYYEEITNNMFILFKVNSNLQKFLDFVKEHPAYVHDYKCGNNHMLVVSFPNKHSHLVPLFLEGKYSELYSTEDVDRLFPKKVLIGNKEEIYSYYRILTKDSTYIPIFQSIIKKEFNVGDKFVPKANEIVELDFPPKLEEEIFNYGFNDS